MDISLVHQSCFLVSDPFLQDAHFERTVVLICDHNEEGTFGFCVNKCADYHLGDVLDTFEGIDCQVFIGGPVEQNTLHIIHRMGSVIDQSTPLGNGLFLGGNFDQVSERIRLGIDSPTHYRFYMGYSGWGPGQLKIEIESDTWLIFESKIRWVFDTPYEKLWKEVLMGQGGIYSQMANYPKDPRMN